jgi:hypothetical protein
MYKNERSQYILKCLAYNTKVQQYKGIVDFGLDRQSKDFGGAIH